MEQELLVEKFEALSKQKASIIKKLTRRISIEKRIRLEKEVRRLEKKISSIVRKLKNGED